MEIDKIRGFTEKFFSNLGCKVFWDGDILNVREVSETFGKYYGKMGPYKIVFDRSLAEEGIETATKGSYLLKAMTNYLNNSGETTLLKINFDVDAEEEIKKKIQLENCHVEKLVKKKRYDYFTRFTFLTTLQYLNGKEQVTNDVYVYKGEIIAGDLSSYDVCDGNKREIKLENIDDAYAIAKDELKNILEDKIGEVSVELQEKLEKELYRIEKHFENKTGETNAVIESCIKKRAILERDLGGDIEDDVEVHAKISRIDAEVEAIEKAGNLDLMQKEKDMEIKSEMQKHSLNISNKMMNTTIIYYPLFSFDAFLKNDMTSRYVEVSYNPLTKVMNNVFCDCCGEKVKVLCMDGSGHLVCENCAGKCPDCGEIYCKKCLTRECAICNRLVCPRCANRCVGCRKEICSSHAQKDPITGMIYCQNCLVKCERCDGYFDKNSMHISPEKGSSICSKCLGAEIKKDTLKSVFE